MVRQEPPECRDREQPSVSPGSVHPDLGHEDFCSVLDSVVDDVAAMIVDTRDNLRQ